MLIFIPFSIKYSKSEFSLKLLYIFMNDFSGSLFSIRHNKYEVLVLDLFYLNQFFGD